VKSSNQVNYWVTFSSPSPMNYHASMQYADLRSGCLRNGWIQQILQPLQNQWLVCSTYTIQNRHKKTFGFEALKYNYHSRANLCSKPSKKYEHKNLNGYTRIIAYSLCCIVSSRQQLLLPPIGNKCR
jgi:hypothetical protein